MTDYIGRVGNYQLVKKLGQGGMGEVFLALNYPSDEPIALKLMRLPKDEVWKQDFQNRFINEAHFVKGLTHASIIKLDRAGETTDYRNNNKALYIAYEYVPGGSLENYFAGLREKGFLIQLDELLELVAQIADGLSYAFDKKKLVHRDIKPANILLKQDVDDLSVRAVVTDFGIAKLMDAESRTVPGMFIGSLPYASPEHRAGKRDVDNRSDIFSLGVLLHELVVGERPDNPPLLDQPFTNPYIPNAVQTIILRALAREPIDRFQTGAEMAHALWDAKQALTPNEISDFARPRYQTASLKALVNIEYVSFSSWYPTIIKKPIEQFRPEQVASIKKTESRVNSEENQQNAKNSAKPQSLPQALPETTRGWPIVTGLGTTALLGICLILLLVAWFAWPTSDTPGAKNIPAIIPTKLALTTLTTPLETPTATPTITTNTSTPTETAIPATPTLAATATAVSFQGVVTVSQQTVNIYVGPGTNYLRIADTLSPGEQVTIIGISANHQWYKIDLVDLPEAWIQAGVVSLTHGSIDEIPEAISLQGTITPSPMPILPTDTPVPPTAVPTLRPSDTPVPPTKTLVPPIKATSTETPCPGFACPPK